MIVNTGLNMHLLLQVFKLGMLSPYLAQCMQLASDKSLREGIVGFPLAPGADGGPQPEHRPGEGLPQA